MIYNECLHRSFLSPPIIIDRRHYKWQDSDWQQPEKTWRTCLIHKGTALIPWREEQGMLICPDCGCRWAEKGAPALTDEAIAGVHKKQQTKIVQGTKKKKFFSKQGDLITDETLIQDVLQGKNVISYKETKSGSDKPVVVKKK